TRLLRRAKKELGELRRSGRLQSTQRGVDGSEDDRRNELLRTGEDLRDARQKTGRHEPPHESSPPGPNQRPQPRSRLVPPQPAPQSSPQATNKRPEPRSPLVALHAASPPRRRVISSTIASA